MFLGLIGTAVVGYAAYSGLAYALRNRVIFPLVGVDFRRWHQWPHREGSTLRFETDAGTGFAYFLPARDRNPRGRVVLYHGNVMVAVDMAALAAKWSDFGFDVVVPEIRGYGGYPGKPTPENVAADTMRALKMLPSISGPLLAHGISLGGGLAMELSRIARLDAVVLQSTFSSIGDAAYRYGLPGFVVGRTMNSVEAVERHSGKVLSIHGDADGLFGLRHAERIVSAVGDASRVRRAVVSGGRHMISEDRIFEILDQNIEWLREPVSSRNHLGEGHL